MTTNLPASAKVASRPFQRISDAVSSILMPKNTKLPLPATMDSNPQPPILTSLSTTTENIPTKTFTPRNSNHQPPNPSQNLPLQNQGNQILKPPNTKSTKSTQISPNPRNDNKNPQNQQKLESAHPTTHPATHATFSYPPTVETFFDDDTNHDPEQEPTHIQEHTSPDALTS